MWQLILKLQHPQLKSPPGEQGFSMIEVLVSILVTTAFVMGTLQAMVINTIFQVRSEREAQATFWIQEDMEKIKAVAELPPLNDNAFKCFASGTTGFENGFGGLLRQELSNNHSISGGTLDVQIAEEKRLVNKTYRMVRIVEGLEATPDTSDDANMQVVDESPHVLRITYKVGEIPKSGDTTEPDTNGLLKADDGKGFKDILAQVYTEVIPSGAFACSSTGF